MAVKIKFDQTHNAIAPTFVLTTRSGRKLGALPAYNIVFKASENAANELSFRINKNDCDRALWHKINDLRLVYSKEYDLFFEINVEIDETNELIKNVTAKSLGEAELSQTELRDIQINTEADILRDDYAPTIIYDESNKSTSLLDRILDKAPHYRIGHVDKSLAIMQRTFSFNTNIYDALQEVTKELECLVQIDATDDGSGGIDRSINLYDLKRFCTVCGYRDFEGVVCPECGSELVSDGHGKDTPIFICAENLAENINYSSDVDSVKNCFKLEAGDDLMTAAVAMCNPNGSAYVWAISDEQREDMSDELKAKLADYDASYEYYDKEYPFTPNAGLVYEYNRIVEKYSQYKEGLTPFTGKNLTPIPTTGLNLDTNNGKLVGTPKSPAENSAIEYFIPIDFEKNPTYALSWDNTVFTGRAIIYGYDADKQYVGRTSGSSTNPRVIRSSSFPGEIKFVRLRLYMNRGTVTQEELNAASIQFEAGSAKTSYSPFGAMTGYSNMTTALYDTIDLRLFLQSGLMPSPEIDHTDAAAQAAILNEGEISSVAVQTLSGLTETIANNSILSTARTVVDPRYNVTIKSSALTNYSWTGVITVTSFSDEEDTADTNSLTITFNQGFDQFVKQKIDRILARASDEKTDVSDILSLSTSDLAAEAEKYCVSRLTSFHDACQAVLDVLVQQGIAERSTWADKNPDLYTELYLPYYNKLGILESAIRRREQEIAIVDQMQDEINNTRAVIHDALDFQKYLGETLWMEFVSYRREDTWENKNFISDGLDNAALFEQAIEFYETARKDIAAASTSQHSISSTLKNLLVMKEFEAITDDFELGNWIRIRVDENIYRLRLIEYEIDYDNLDTINVEFSDIKAGADAQASIQSILKQASSMATSYPVVARQASQGAKSQDILSNWADYGMALTKTKIMDSDNQSMVLDNHGLLGREYLDDSESYDDKQTKLINRGLYFTIDNWETVQAALGDFTFYNPETGQVEEDYGIIAKTIVGKIILGEKVGIYNENNNVTMDGRGLIITTSSTGSEEPLFLIQKKTGNTTEPILYVDDDGNVVLNGSITIKKSGGDFSSLGEVVIRTERWFYQSSSSTALIGDTWSTTPQTWIDGKYLWVKDRTYTADGQYTDSDAVCLTGATGATGAKGEPGTNGTNGTNGMNTAIVYLYKRSSSAVSVNWTTELTYNFETKHLTSVPAGWSETIPSGTDPIYVTAATASSNTSTDNIPVSEWVTPVVLAQNGTNGTNGTSVSISSTSVTYQKGSSGTSKPTGTWDATVPDVEAGKYLWVKTVVAYSDGSSTESYSVSRMGVDGTPGANGEDGNDGVSPTVSSTAVEYQQSTSGTTVPTGSWNATPPTATAGQYMWTRTTVTYSDGATAVSYSVAYNGTNGTNGLNSATVFLYQRAATSPAKPTASLTYTFSTGKLSGTLGNWTQTIPSGTNPCWVITATASANTTTDSIAASEWSDVSKLSENGTNGYNQATIFLYQRASSAPSKPSAAVTYTFATGALSSVPTGWSRAIPASDGNPCWVTTASAVSQGETDSIGANEWSAVTKLVEDGANGADGKSLTGVTEYYARNNSTTAPADSAFGTGVLAPTASEKYVWNYELLSWNDNGTTSTTKTSKHIVAIYGDKGNTGKSLTGVTEYYAVSNSTTAPADSSFDTTVKAPTAENKYLWNYELMSWDDNGTTSTTKTDKHIAAVYGDKGEDGLSAASVFVYQRAESASSITKPSTTLTYTFATGVLSGSLGGWSQTVPASDGNPCYMIQATAIGTGATDDIASSEWSNPVMIVKDGETPITLRITTSGEPDTDMNLVLNAEAWIGNTKLSDAELASAGTIRWYPNHTESPVFEGAAYTVNTSETSYIEARLESDGETISGNPVVFEYTGTPLKRLRIHLSPVQSGTGDPSPTNQRTFKNWTSVLVSDTGRNMFVNGTWTGSTTLVAPRSPVRYQTDNDVYTFYNISDAAGCYVYAYEADGTYVGRTVGAVRTHYSIKRTAFTSGNGSKNYDAVAFLEFRYYSVKAESGLTPDTAEDSQIMLLHGDYDENIQGTYEEYTGGTVEVPLPTDAGTICSGVRDLLSGQFTSDRLLVTYDGSETWKAADTAGTFYIPLPESCRFAHTPMCDTLLSLESGRSDGLAENQCRINASGSNLLVRPGSEITTVAALKASLTEQPISVLYTMSEPVVYDSDRTELPLITGENTLFTNIGTVELIISSEMIARDSQGYGRTSYLHVKYSDDGVTFTGNNGKDIGAYIGTYTDFIKEDSSVFSDYEWHRFADDSELQGRIGAVDDLISVLYEAINGNGDPDFVSIKSQIETSDTGIAELYERIAITNSILSKTNAKIQRGFIDGPSFGKDGKVIRDQSGNVETKRYFGIAIAKTLSLNMLVIDRPEDDPENDYYKIIGSGNTFGLYTDEGWQFWRNGELRGWFDSSDGMLHAIDFAAEDKVRLGGEWWMSNKKGFGLRRITVANS